MQIKLIGNVCRYGECDALHFKINIVYEYRCFTDIRHTIAYNLMSVKQLHSERAVDLTFNHFYNAIIIARKFKECR